MASWWTWLFWLSILMFVSSIVVVVIIVTRLPPDYLTRTTSLRESFRQHHPALRLILIVAKNALGLLFVSLGIVMLVMPGQGMLFIALGVMLLDFPGKQKLERRILGSRRILEVVNKIRTMTRQPPLAPPLDAPVDPPPVPTQGDSLDDE